MKNVVCLIVSVMVFGIILFSEYEKTVVRGDKLIAKYQSHPKVDYGELKVEGVDLKNYAVK